MKVVFDTDIHISAFVIPGGNAERAYLHAIEGDFNLCTSIAILTELARKLDEKFGWEKHRIEQVITAIGNLATIFKPSPRLKVVSDDPDNRVLECALEAGAELIVTGDQHLLKLIKYQHVGIIRLSTFLTTLNQPPDP
ncbi:MAG: putative toxin-antitoxin system toxin component, PIN family [Deltaproteobacteria bacterium]|nr:putative toxin-antitoxin system toxin component, PIN family [Deltaproteobacteria bacterium]